MALSSELTDFLKQRIFGLGIGYHLVVFQNSQLSIPVTIEKRIHRPGCPGTLLVARHWPGKSNDLTVRKAFDDKLPKLKAFSTDSKILTKVLLLEQNSVAGAVWSDVRSYLEVRGVPSWLPDEIWMMWTPALETEKYMHVARLWPMGDLKGDWKDGTITSNYP